MRLHRIMATAVLVLGCFSAKAESETGTLVVQVSPFTSEVDIKPKVASQLKTGGVEWGLQGNQMVVTLVNKRFVDFDINYMTRYGSTQTLQLPPGSYQLTTLGFEPHTAFSVEKVLAKSAYVNENIVSFDVVAGKTTTMKMDPIVVDQDNTIFVTYFIPTLFVTVANEDAATDSPTSSKRIPINVRGEQSVTWPDYKGKLKFVAQ